MALSRHKYIDIYTPFTLTVKKKAGSRTSADGDAATRASESSSYEVVDCIALCRWKGDKRIYTNDVMKALRHLKASDLKKDDKSVSKIEVFQKELIKIANLSKIKVGIADTKSDAGSRSQTDSGDDEPMLYSYVIANSTASVDKICSDLEGKVIEIANKSGPIKYARKA